SRRRSNGFSANRAEAPKSPTKKGEPTDRGRDGPPTHQTGLPDETGITAIFAHPPRGCASDVSPRSGRVNHEPDGPTRPFHQHFLTPGAPGPSPAAGQRRIRR